MPETRGFEVVAEVKDFILLAMLKAAWDNGGTSDPGAIPHEVPIPAGTALGPYVATGGQVTIPKEGLSLAMAPAQDGVTVGIAASVQVNLDPNTTHLDSLTLLDMQAAISITAPIATIAGSAPNLGVVFEGLPRANVAVSLTSGNPIDALTLELITEYVHGLHEAGTIPHTQSFPGQSYLIYHFDVYLEIYDDQSDAARAIVVSQPDATHVRLSLPVYLRLSNLSGVPGIGLLSPMAVTARLVLDVPYQRTASQVTVQLSSAAVSVESVAPAAGAEGAHYTTAVGIDASVATMFTSEITARGQALLAALGTMQITTPTTAQIEALIGDHVHTELLARRYAGVWTPASPDGSPVTITEARPKVLAEALAIAINPGASADEDLLTDFVPPGAAFAIGLDDDFVERTIGEIVARPESEGGFGGVPHEFPDIAGHRVRLNSLSWELQNGKIHFSGSCTCYDVFCGADADVDFWADVGLRWSTPDASGAQTLIPELLDSDASLPWWAWLLAILSFLFGLILGIIWLVITIVIDKLVDKLGASVMTDEVSGQLQVLGAWPQQLQGVGTVTSTFDEAVLIEPSGLRFTGSMLMTSTHALTTVSFANSHGPYLAMAASPIVLQAGPPSATVTHRWDLGDGTVANGHQVSHVYREDGLYVVRLTTRVNEPGGAETHHSALVRVSNVRPVVDAGADITVNEGQSFNLLGRFSDAEWVDTHEAVWDFGDDTLPTPGVVSETNAPPAAAGTVSGTHAYCNDGDYTVKLRVRDDDGGVGEDTLEVHVKNVPPKVTVDSPLYAYPCVPVTLVARFTDPGWCDTHVAMWKFGDGDYALPPTPATVREVNAPPIGYGIAAATHTYHALATLQATCVVRDPSGASDIATLTVAVVDLMNKRFEDGFRNLPLGTVANEWTPYAAGLPRVAVMSAERDVVAHATTLPGGAQLFDAEELVVRDGQRSQRIQLGAGMRAGLWQSVGANVGWDYQVIAHCHIDGRCSGRVRLGLDPAGGQDETAPSIVWSEGTQVGSWQKLLVRVTAETKRVTVFLESEAQKQLAYFYFDAISFEPFPCKLPEPVAPELEPEPQTRCVDFHGEQQAQTLPEPYEKAGFSFTNLGVRPLRIVLWGEPSGQGKLAFEEKGTRVTLPFTAQSVRATVASYTSKPVRLQALDAGGAPLGAEVATDPALGHAAQTLVASHAGIVAVAIGGGGGEGLLIELCITNIGADGAGPRKARASDCGCKG